MRWAKRYNEVRESKTSNVVNFAFILHSLYPSAFPNERMKALFHFVPSLFLKGVLEISSNWFGQMNCLNLQKQTVQLTKSINWVYCRRVTILKLQAWWKMSASGLFEILIGIFFAIRWRVKWMEKRESAFIHSSVIYCK